jgi:hypothetical protein
MELMIISCISISGLHILSEDLRVGVAMNLIGLSGYRNSADVPSQLSNVRTACEPHAARMFEVRISTPQANEPTGRAVSYYPSTAVDALSL